MVCFGKIPNVHIVDIKNNEITFEADSRLANATNRSPVHKRRLLGKYTRNREDIFVTSGYTNAANIQVVKSVEFEKGSKGPIYLNARALHAVGASAEGECIIRGAIERPDMALSDELFVALKWPECGGYQGHSGEELKLSPTCIRIDVHVGGEQISSVNLLDPSLAHPSQDVSWDGCSKVGIRLTPRGFSTLNQPFANDGMLWVWPTAIRVVGVPLGDGTRGEVDLRDLQRSAPHQHLTWNARGQPVEIQLMDRGLVNFGRISAQFRALLARVENDRSLLINDDIKRDIEVVLLERSSLVERLRGDHPGVAAQFGYL